VAVGAGASSEEKPDNKSAQANTESSAWKP